MSVKDFFSLRIVLFSMLLWAGTHIATANNGISLKKGDVSRSVQTTVSGTVTDTDGLPLAGANVLVKGTTNGTQTDFDGNYSISANNDAILVFSYIGFLAKEVAVNGQNDIDVQLAEDTSNCIVRKINCRHRPTRQKQK